MLARKKKQSGWLVEPAPDCAPWEYSVVSCVAAISRTLSAGMRGIGTLRGNLWKTVTVLRRVRIGEARESWRQIGPTLTHQLFRLGRF